MTVRDKTLVFTDRYFWPMFVLGIIGVIAVIWVIASLFIHGADHSTPVTLTEDLEVGSPEFLETLSRLLNVPISKGSEVKLLQNGEEYQPALIEAINEAEKSITISTYIWEEGKFNDRVVKALLSARQRGVEVLVLLDGHDGDLPEKDRDSLEDAGARIGIYHPITFRELAYINQRTHRRAIVFDGERGFIGGMAIQDEWLGGGKKEDEWRDTMFEVQGEMARSLQSAFADTWFESTGEIIAGDMFYSNEDIKGEENSFVHIISTPSGDSRPIQATFLMTVLGARDRLWIANPYFLPDPVLLSALRDRAQNGVDVRILLPGDKTDYDFVRWASHAFYEDLLEAGVKIYEYEPSLMHVKAIMADGVWSVIGTANMDSRSRILNQENVMGIVDPKLTGELEQAFLEDLKYSTQFTSEEWKKRSIFEKVRTKAALLVGKQL
jgi:cardiolipin synthase A/B